MTLPSPLAERVGGEGVALVCNGVLQKFTQDGMKGLSSSSICAALGVTRTTLSELVNEKRGISPEMAVRLSKVFGGNAETWLTQQAHYDLAQVRADRIRLKRLELA